MQLEVPRNLESGSKRVSNEVIATDPGAKPLVSSAPTNTRKSRWKMPLWVPVTMALFAGVLLGVLIMHQRNKANKVIVSVNDTRISKDALFNRLQAYAGIPMMHKMVEEELQLQFAAKEGVVPTDAQVDAKFAQLSTQPGFAQKLAASGQSIASFKHGLRINLAQQGVITQGVTVTEAQAQQFYQANIDSHNPRSAFYTPETIVLRAIITGSRAESLNALQDLKKGIDFGLVANTYNRDQSKAANGLLPPIQRGRSQLTRVPALENAFFKLTIGQQAGPIAVGNVWWIVRCEERVRAKVVPYRQVRAECVTGAKFVKGVQTNGPMIQKKFHDFEMAANLQAFWPQYQTALSKN